MHSFRQHREMSLQMWGGIVLQSVKGSTHLTPQPHSLKQARRTGSQAQSVKDDGHAMHVQNIWSIVVCSASNKSSTTVPVTGQIQACDTRELARHI
jgi:hypothetical protein